MYIQTSPCIPSSSVCVCSIAITKYLRLDILFWRTQAYLTQNFGDWKAKGHSIGSNEHPTPLHPSPPLTAALFCSRWHPDGSQWVKERFCWKAGNQSGGIRYNLPKASTLQGQTQYQHCHTGDQTSNTLGTHKLSIWIIAMYVWVFSKTSKESIFFEDRDKRFRFYEPLV